MNVSIPFRAIHHLVVAIALLAVSISTFAMAQETAIEPTTLPFTVKQVNSDLEVVTYSGLDGRLQSGDIIRVVGNSVTQDTVDVTTLPIL